MTPLGQALASRIREGGPIGVDAYMATALGDPDHGYYTTRQPFGAAGDFITAPEISQVFGELVGLWCAVVWQRLGAPAPVHLVEFGPGRGTLLADALRAIAHTTPAFAAALRPTLIETAHRLRAVQAQTLAAGWTGAAPVWRDRLVEVGDGAMIVIANEFFDALPIKQFVRTVDGWRERCIGVDEAAGRFVFTLGAAAASPLPDDFAGDVVPGAIVERCPEGEDLATAIGARCMQAPGAALIVDYGHDQTQPGETLQGVRRHRFAAVLDRPGESDLSHHVDFASLARAARAVGASVFGPLAQGLFLGRLGIAERAATLIAAAPAGEAEIAGAVRRLVHPGRMGVLFKALTITAPALATLPGFCPVDTP